MVEINSELSWQVIFSGHAPWPYGNVTSFARSQCNTLVPAGGTGAISTHHVLPADNPARRVHHVPACVYTPCGT